MARILACGFLLLLAPRVAVAASQPDALGNIPVLRAATLDQVHSQVVSWLQERAADPAVLSAAEEIWQPGTGPFAGAAALDRLAATFALVDARAKSLLELLSLIHI